MTRKQLLTGLVLGIIGFGFGAFQSTSGATQPGTTQQWEYGILVLGETLTAFETFEKFDGSNLDPMLQFDDADEIIDMVGKRGWELVTVERLNVGAEQQLRWYFKRPHR